jgi:high-affinity iron transporter
VSLRTVFGVVCAAVVLLLAAPAVASAQGFGTEEAIKELNTSRDMIERSLEQYGDGQRDEAYETARNAYLDHFEFVEIPLRVRDEGLTLELEEDYANLRNAIQDGAPAGEVDELAAELRAGLDRVERELGSPGIGAPLLAALMSFVLLFREGLEAVLVVAAILGFLEASRNRRYRGSVLKGVGAGAVATVVTFLLVSLVLEVAPVQRELLEAVTLILAIVVLFYVSFWLIARLEHRRWMEFVKARVWGATATGATLALAGIGFTAVYREGFETVLLYQALLDMTTGLTLWVALGALAGAVALTAVGLAIFRLGRKLPIKTFLSFAVILVMAMSVAFVGNAVRELQQATFLPITFLEDVPRLPIFLADLTGWHPTLQSLLAQAVLAAIYVAGAVWVFAVMPYRERRATRATGVPDEAAAPDAQAPAKVPTLAQPAGEQAGRRG